MGLCWPKSMDTTTVLLTWWLFNVPKCSTFNKSSLRHSPDRDRYVGSSSPHTASYGSLQLNEHVFLFSGKSQWTRLSVYLHRCVLFRFMQGPISISEVK